MTQHVRRPTRGCAIDRVNTTERAARHKAEKIKLTEQHAEARETWLRDIEAQVEISTPTPL